MSQRAAATSRKRARCREVDDVERRQEDGVAPCRAAPLRRHKEMTPRQDATCSRDVTMEMTLRPRRHEEEDAA